MYESVINDIVFPEKSAWESFLTDFFDVLMLGDMGNALEPLNQYAESRQEITRKLDRLSFFKGAVVLRMFKDALGDKTFTRGVRNYLNERQQQSATPEDFFSALQQAYDEDFPEVPLNISELITPWVDFNGFPVVTVSRNGSSLLLTQAGFRTSHEELFNIPINYATASNPNFDETRVDFWLTSSDLEVLRDEAPKNWTDDDWVIVNLRDTGYYVTNYDEDLWRLIIQSLNEDHEAIHFLNRGTLFADFHRFLQVNFDIDATLFLQLMQSLPLEEHPHVWVRADAGLQKIENRLRGSELYDRLLSYMRDVLGPVYNDNRFENHPRASEVVTLRSCFAGVQECLNVFLEPLLNEMVTGERPTTDRCIGFMGANETVWRHFFDRTLTARNDETAMIMRSLVCTRDRNLLRLLLDTAFDTSNFLFVFERSTIFSSAANQNAESYEVLIEFIEENGASLGGITDIGNLIYQAAMVTNTEEQAERVSLIKRSKGSRIFWMPHEPNFLVSFKASRKSIKQFLSTTLPLPDRIFSYRTPPPPPHLLLMFTYFLDTPSTFEFMSSQLISHFHSCLSSRASCHHSIPSTESSSKQFCSQMLSFSRETPTQLALGSIISIRIETTEDSS